ncbi:MAG: HNH endonuclease signature motif containing protein [Pseudomonadota bacterium]
MKGRAIKYNEAELAFIKANSTLPRAQMTERFNERFGRKVKQSNLHALCKRNRWLTGRTGCFASGNEPMNKGKKMPYNANSAANHFKPGHLPHNTKNLGHERLCKDGYVLVSVAQRNPHTGYNRCHVHKHRWLWEQQNGKVPDGYCLKCLDGDKTNTDPSNWQAIPRAVNARLNGRGKLQYDEAPAQLKPTILATAKLEQAISEARSR